MPRPKVTSSNFWRRVDQSAGLDGCWPWTGHTSGGRGRGRVDINGVKGVYCARVAYYFEYPGQVELNAKDGRHILHSCDNPICCNPRHLRVGSHAENMRDKVERGRSKWFDSSVDSPRAKLTAEDVFWIRIQKQHGATYKALALLYDVSPVTIKGVISGRHYKDV